MKMHILAAALLTALAARGASASSEGGDTWSAPRARSAVDLGSAGPHMPPPRPPVWTARWDGSEGGDTWSASASPRQAGSGDRSAPEDRAASSDTGVRTPHGRFRGGDTCRAFSAEQGGPARTAGLAAKPML